MANSEEEQERLPVEVGLPSPRAEWAVEDARNHGQALLKFLAPNDVKLTGSHQYGVYLPKPARHLFQDSEPVRGENHEQSVVIRWPNGRETESCIHYWGKRTRNEYQLTRFGRGFPFLQEDDVGSLFVLVPVSRVRFHAHVLANADEIEHVVDSLGVDLPYDWGGIFQQDGKFSENTDECVARRFRDFTDTHDAFPKGIEIAGEVWETVENCQTQFFSKSVDEQLLLLHDLEFDLFSIIEKRLYDANDHGRMLLSVDAFLNLAQTMLNRRKRRAGLALENHVEYLLRRNQIPFDSQPTIDGNPDIVIPGKSAYDDVSYPLERFFLLAVKRTCRER